MDLNHGWAAAFEQVAWLLTPIFELAIIFVLWKRRTLQALPIFAAYLITDAVRSTSLWLIGGSTFAALYRAAWVYSEPVMLLFSLAVVLEVIGRLYKVYPGIESFARIAMAVAVVAAVLFTAFTSPLNIRRPSGDASSHLLLQLFQIERVLDLVLCVFVAVTVALFPAQHYATATRSHGFLLSALFGSASAAFYAINYGSDSEIVGFVALAVQLVLYSVWIKVLLAPDPVPLPEPLPDEVARIEQLNEDLLVLMQWLTRRRK